jgi:hypothetical protein
MNGITQMPDKQLIPTSTPMEPLPSKAKWIVRGFVVFIGLLLLSPSGGVLLFVFPALAFVVGAYLYRRHLPTYVSFVCWLWFLSPLLRRMVDYRNGFHAPATILLAPPLACISPIAWLVADWRKLFHRQTGPLLCMVALCAYGTVLGILNFPIRPVLQDLVSWLAPLIFALMLSRHRDQAPELFRAFERALLYGVLTISIYGIVQFFVVPIWDALWMIQMNSTLNSIGNPEPTEIRVFSSMNAPQVLAAFLAAGLILAFNAKSKVRMLAIPLGLLCLMLSLARSGWVAMFAGTAYLAFSSTLKQRLQLVAATAISIVIVLVSLQNPDLNKVISQRFESLSDVKNDESYLDRVNGYRALFMGLADNPFGLGMGSVTAVNEDVSGTLGLSYNGVTMNAGDSSLAMLVSTMGLVGTIVVCVLLMQLGMGLFSGTSGNSPQIRALRAVAVGLAAESLLCGMLAGPVGFLLWATVGFSLALGGDEQAFPYMAVAGV